MQGQQQTGMQSGGVGGMGGFSSPPHSQQPRGGNGAPQGPKDANKGANKSGTSNGALNQNQGYNNSNKAGQQPPVSGSPSSGPMMGMMPSHHNDQYSMGVVNQGQLYNNHFNQVYI